MRKLYIAISVLAVALLIWCGLNIRVDHRPQQRAKILANIDHMQRLMIYSKTATATYDNTTAGSHKMGDKYTYTVYGKPYTGQVEIELAPQTQQFNVEYLPDTIPVHSINPALELRVYRQQLGDFNNQDPEDSETPIDVWVIGGVSIVMLGLSVVRLLGRGK